MGMGIPFLPLTFSIDVGTFAHRAIYNFFNPPANFSWYIKDEIEKIHDPKDDYEKRYIEKYLSDLFKPSEPRPSVSVIVPAYNEEESLEATIRSLYDQKLKPKNVIVVDDCSKDKTPEICQRLQEELEDFIYVRRDKNSGKANNINYTVREFGEELGDITLINDSDVLVDNKYLEKIVENFKSDDVAAFTPYGYTIAPKNFVARVLHNGNDWNNSVFKFRKKAQGYRNGISVVCGASTAYRTDILKKIPIPERTKTEDTDYTWLLQENGYRLVYDEKAIVHSHDLESPSGLLRQWFRWYSGNFQSFYVHGKDILKAKSLFWTTLLPGIFESVPYAIGVTTLPVIAALNLAMPDLSIPFFNMNYVKGFLLADFLLTTIPTAIISYKHLLHLPEIYLYKIVGSALSLAAFSKTAYENITGKRDRWTNRWGRGHEKTILKESNLIGELYDDHES
jgi:cellulose synthase/poly-beta-1,6-N-acetylglucosamine synthase-like glycosyltransferase